MLDPAVLDALHYPLLTLAVLAVLFSAALIAVAWQSLPSSIPVHFGLTGEPDRWGGRWHLFLLLFVQVGLNVALWFTGQRGLLFTWLMALTSILLAFCVWSMIRVARREASRLNPFILCGFLAMILVPALMKGLR